MKRKILKMLLTGLLVLSMGLGACRSGEDGNFSSSDSSPRDSFSQISSSSRTDSSSALPDVSAVVFLLRLRRSSAYDNGFGAARRRGSGL